MGDAWQGRRILSAAKVARWERDVTAAAMRVLDRREAEMVAAVRSVTAAVAIPWGGFDTWDQDVDEEVGPVVQAILTEATATIIDQFGQRGKLNAIDVGPRVDHLLEGIKGLGPDTAAAITDTLTQGAALGEGIPKLTSRVLAAFETSRVDARRIARTETIGATNGASNDMAGELYAAGVITTKTWLATSDDRTRPSHVAADGQTVPFDQPYQVGDVEMMVPHDDSAPGEEVWNCRCTETYQ